MGFAELSTWSSLVILVASAGDPAFDVDHVGILRSKISGAALEQPIGELK